MVRIALVLTLLLALVPAADAAERTIAPLSALTPISALDGHLVWSQYDPATKRYSLVDSFLEGPPRVLPIASRSVPFDADLGREPGGSDVVAYSRCAKDPTRIDAVGRPVWSSARGCRLYDYSLRDNRERRIPHTHAAGASEYLPSVWMGRVAFVRSTSPRRAPQIHLGARILRGGTTARTFSSFDATQLDLNGGSLAFTWEFDEGADGHHAWELWLDSTGGSRHTLVDMGVGGEECATQPLFPVLTTHALIYVRRSNCVPSSMNRYSIATGARQVGGAPRLPEAMANNEGKTWFVDQTTLPPYYMQEWPSVPDCATDGCAVVHGDPPRWQRAPRRNPRPLRPLP